LQLWAVLLCAIAPFTVDATTLKDIKIGVHVFDFVISPLNNRASIGVIYDPRNKDSTEDAQAIFDSLMATVARNNSGLRPVMVDVKELDEMGGLRAAVISEHMKPFYDKFATYARRTSTLTLSADLDCVRSNKCIIGIASVPRVEIVVSSQLAQASAIQFSEAFRMMVTEY
jgi:hypothetical protein